MKNNDPIAKDDAGSCYSTSSQSAVVTGSVFDNDIDPDRDALGSPGSMWRTRAVRYRGMVMAHSPKRLATAFCRLPKVKKSGTDTLDMSAATYGVEIDL